ncbi:MAG: cytochrome C oxidase subunit IV family protein [Pseudomonadota bacterium]
MVDAKLKLTFVWLVLCLTTLLSVGASEASFTQHLALIALGIAFFKVLLVMIYFMELPLATRKYRAAYLGWVVVVLLALVALARA